MTYTYLKWNPLLAINFFENFCKKHEYWRPIRLDTKEYEFIRTNLLVYKKNLLLQELILPKILSTNDLQSL